MHKPSAKNLQTLRDKISKFVPVLQEALKKEIKEADTRIIIDDILQEVFEYDKYFEVSAEQMIKGTYADYEIKLDDEKRIIIEVKSISTSLKPTHLRQAVNYAASEGIRWAILTNGVAWEVYKVIIDKQVDKRAFFKFNLINMSDRDVESLYFLTKSAFSKGYLEEYWHYKNAINPTAIANIILSDEVTSKIRKEIGKSSGYRPTNDEIRDIIVNRIIRSDMILEYSAATQKDKNEMKVKDLSKAVETMTPVQKKVLSIILESSEPISPVDIKKQILSLSNEELEKLGMLDGKFNMGPVFRGMHKRLGTLWSQTEDGKYFVEQPEKIRRFLTAEQKN